MLRKPLFWVATVLVALAAVGGLAATHYHAYEIRTGSMTPHIPAGSLVVVREGHVQIGEVISFRSPAGVVTHRLIGRNADGTLITKGDANPSADVYPVPPSRVIGHVVAAPSRLGFWIHTATQTPLGLATDFAAVSLLVLAMSMRRKKPQVAPQDALAVL